MRSRLSVALLGAICFLSHWNAAVAQTVDAKAKQLEFTNPTVVTETKPADAKLPEVPPVLMQRIDAAIQSVEVRPLDTTFPFWTVFHAVLGMGPGSTILEDPKTGAKVNALEYMLSGANQHGEINGQRFLPTAHGLEVSMAGFPQWIGQGHRDQFLAEMIQWGVPKEKKVTVLGREYKMLDFANHSRMTASLNAKQELSWTIIVIASYYGTNHSWTNELGEKLTYDDIVRYEMKEPVISAACGGTHRLFGMTWALQHHLKSGGKREGLYKDLSNHLDRYVAIAKDFQYPNGLFSTQYFGVKSDQGEDGDKLGTSGHTFEWLAQYLPERELRSEWMMNGAENLSSLFKKMQNDPVESGALYHAVHGLKIYRHRLTPKTAPAKTPRT